MKTVFSSNQEFCHVWASQNQDYGKAGNISFRQGVIRSYSTSMGRIIENVVLLNYRKYSVTTSAHQSIISQAVSHLKKFYVESIEPDHEVNVAGYVDRIKDTFGQYFRARSRKAWIFESNHELHKELIDYANHFNVNYPASVSHYVLAETSAAAQAQKGRHEEKQRQERRAAKSAIEDAEIAWFNNVSNRTSVEVAGKTYQFSQILLRFNKLPGEVQTSHGAKVPSKDAKILYKRIKAGKPVHGFKIGFYTVTGLNGTLRIGCHNISQTEIDRFAAVMKW